MSSERSIVAVGGHYGPSRSCLASVPEHLVVET
jgi:hypothetical protein